MNAPDFAIEIDHWKHTAPLLALPEDDEAFNRTQQVVDFLLDEIGEDESHPLVPLLDVLGERIEQYEAIHYPMPAKAGATDMLRHLMHEYGLRQGDLPEIGSQGVVSEILSGKRTLNFRQSKALAKRFGIPLGNFLAD